MKLPQNAKHILRLYAHAIMTQALQVVTVTVTGDRDGDIDLNLNWASQDTQIIITNTNQQNVYIIHNHIENIFFSCKTLQSPTPLLPPYFHLFSI